MDATISHDPFMPDPKPIDEAADLELDAENDEEPAPDPKPVERAPARRPRKKVA